jgi:C-terminal processing protease CtpA/Prc
MRKILVILFLSFHVLVKAQELNRLSAAEKVYGLSKMWQEVNYNFVFLNKIDRQKWDSLYMALLTDVQKTKNDYEYYRELQRFYAFLKDGHTNITGYPGYIDSSLLNSNFGRYRIFVKNINNKAIIVRTNTSSRNEIPVGSEITEVNGLTTKEYINKHVAPYISSSTGYGLEDAATSLMFLDLKGSTYLIKIKTPKGSIKEMKLIHEPTPEEDVYPPFEEFKPLEFKWLHNQIAYCSLNTFGYQKLDSLFEDLLPQLTTAKGLIIDLRKNGGGNTEIARNIFKYLTYDTLLYGSKSYTRLLNSTYKAWGKFFTPKDTLEDAEYAKYYRSYHDNLFYEFPYFPDTIKRPGVSIVVPTTILIGHNTASAAEDFLIYADNQKHMVTIGENSNGSTGQPLLFDLPGGGGARVCTKRDTYPDGREFVGYGIKPHIEIKMTVEDFIRNNDPVLKKAVDYLTSRAKK